MALLFGAGLLLAGGPLGAQSRPMPLNQASPVNLPGDLNVKRLLLDRDGFLWMGTDLGLHRFDGYTTQLVSTVAREGLRLADNDILSLYEDRQGCLWIGTGNGLHCLNRRRTAVQTYLVEEDVPRNGKNAISCVLEDRRGTRWCGTGEGAVFAAPPGGGFRRVPNSLPQYPDGLFSPVVNITEGKDGQLWVATQQRGLYRLSAEGTLLQHFPAGLVFAAVGGEAGVPPVVSTEQELLSYHPGLQQFAPLLTHRELGVAAGGFRCLFQDAEYIWLKANFKLYRVHRQTRAIEDYTARVAGSQTLDVHQVYRDAAGNLWLSTTSGVFRMGNRNHYFTVLAAPQARPYGFFSTRGLLEDGEKLYVGSYQGFYAYDVQQQTYREHRYWKPQLKQWLNPLALALLKDPDGTVWVGSEGNGLMQFDPRTGAFRTWALPGGDGSAVATPGSKVSNVYALLRDHRQRLWMGTEGGLFRLDPAGGKAAPAIREVNAPHLHQAKIMALHESADHSLWVGTSQGLYRQSADGAIAAHYRGEGPAGRLRLSNSYVHCIYEDPAGNLWLGTKGGGVNVLNPRRGTLRVYTVEDGLANNVVYAVLPGPGGQLWMSTDGGLSRLDPARGRFLNFDVRDGLPENEFNFGSALRGSSGTLYFGGLQGVVAFDPARVQPREPDPRVKLTKLVQHQGASGRTVENSLAAGTVQTIRLGYQDRFFTVHFALEDVYQTDKAQFAYRLVGVSPEWQYTGTANYLQFTGLPAGDYVLELKGANRKGLWTPAPLSVPVHVEQAFYATRWAYLLYAGGLLLLAGGVIRFQWNRIRLRHRLALDRVEKEKLLEVDRMKSRFFANIAHEFRTPLTLILGPAEKILSQTAEPPSRRWAGQVQRNAAQLLGLINQLLDLSKLESGLEKLDLAETDAVAFVRDAVTALQSLGEQKGVRLYFHGGVEALPVYLDADKLQKILYNLLGNACTYTPSGGSVTVAVRTVDQLPGAAPPGGWMELEVADTGIGIAEGHLPFLFDRYFQVPDARKHAALSTGIGLALVKELVELHGGTIRVTSTLGAGTTFTVRLPGVAAPAGTAPPVHSQAPAPPPAPGLLSRPAGEPEPPLAADDAEPSEKPVILVVEDHPGVRAFTVEVLFPAYRVLEAANGAEGIQVARETIPDVILSDVMMPVMDGYTFLHLVKTDERTCHIPVVLLTARNSAASRLEGLQTGADAYLAKPFHVQELLLTVRNLLNLRLKIQQQFAGPPAARPAETAPQTPDASFLQRFTALVDARLDDEHFGVEEMSSEIGMSRTQLHRKVKAVTGHSTSHLMRTVRLQRALEMLRREDLPIAEIAFRVGFSSPSYFTETFHKHFGYPPSEARKQQR